MTRLRISESALTKFTTCQEQWRLSRVYRPTGKPAPFILDGGEAHRIMKDGGKPSSNRVARLVSALKKLEDTLGVTVIGREVEQIFEIAPEIDLVRIIDAYGYDLNGKPVIIDYKTTDSGKAWEPIMGNNVPPAALGWQSSAYLLPPPSDLYSPFETWPSTIYFLVASPYEAIGVFGVGRSRRREKELLAKVGDVKELLDKRGYEWAARTFGYHCRFCDFAPICYDVDGWENAFTKREVER